MADERSPDTPPITLAEVGTPAAVWSAAAPAASVAHPADTPGTLPEPTHGSPPPAWVDADGTDPSSPGCARYTNRSELARGGMGVVYLARDNRLNRDVVVKTIRRESRTSPLMVARFWKETQITARLQHPGVPPVHDSGHLPDGSPYIVMKWVRGQTLAELLKARPDPATDRGHLVRIFTQVAQTIAYAHSRGVIHRDLKPSNVMVGEYGEVQVMDWGLAKVLSESGPGADPLDDAPGPDAGAELTQAGTVMGTPAYMPPEQANGFLDRVGPPADVFALGAMLCEIITGQGPYSDAPTGDGFAAALARARGGDTGETVHRLTASGAPQELIDLSLRCLEPHPAARPRDAAVVVEALLAWEQDAQFRDREAAVSLSISLSRRLSANRLRQTLLGLVTAGLFYAAAIGAVATIALGLFGLVSQVEHVGTNPLPGGLMWLAGAVFALTLVGLYLRHLGSRDPRQPRYRRPGA